MIRAKALTRCLATKHTAHSPKLLIKSVRGERNDVVRLDETGLATLRMNVELALTIMFAGKLNKNVLTDLVELPALDGRVPKIEKN